MVTLIDHVLQDFNIMNKKDIHKLIKKSVNEVLYENFKFVILRTFENKSAETYIQI